MLRIVLEGSVAAAHVVNPVTTLDVCIPVEIVVHINVDIAVAPATTIAPASVIGCSDHHSYAEGNGHSRGDITRGRRRRIVDRRVWVNGWSIDHSRIIGGNIDHFGVGL